jgi:hypothetical protein
MQERTDSNERIDSTRTRLTRPTASVIPKVKRPEHTQFDLFLLFLVIPIRFARLGHRRRRRRRRRL